MSAISTIRTTVFAAYLRCSTKAYLLAQGEEPPGSFFIDTLGRISSAYKATACERLGAGVAGFASISRLPLPTAPAPDRAVAFVDCETASYALDIPTRAPSDRKTRRDEFGPDYVPVLFSAWDQSDQLHNLLVCFGALAIQQVIGREIPSVGKVIYGEGHYVRTIKIADYLSKTQQVLEAIISAGVAAEPALVLNKHCRTCDFQTRCRGLAVEQENLSLLGAMTAKERMRCGEKGISTITQLSYGYRPRRKRRVKQNDPPRTLPVRHDHKLKALAIKKAQTHVIGSPSLSLQGTPVFMDVEGMPDRGFYYLIGLRYDLHGTPVERSFWADKRDDEANIWQQCLCALKEIDNPQIVHYGAYENRFLKHMRERWKPAAEDAELLDRLINESVNLLSLIHARIYFPSYSNSLKDTAKWLGFEWTWQQASGPASILLRRCWELTFDDTLKRELIAYNIEDCRAAGVITDAIARNCGASEAGRGTKLELVNVDSLAVGFQRTFGKFPSALPEFERINAAAYWDYQRSKVYVRSSKTIRQSIRTNERAAKRLKVDKEVTLEKRPAACYKCGSSKVWRVKRGSKTIVDLKFTRRGIKRQVVRYGYTIYRCGACNAEQTIFQGRLKYGQAIRTYIAHLLIEMRLSHRQIAEHLANVFEISINQAVVNYIKSELAHKYEPTYRWIFEQIRSGPLVHADETKGVVYGGGHYVWIFANLTTVAYVYSPSREATILDEVLAGFQGVLVSDFYGGYDAVPCQQQKCLIHLMRDINEDVLKHPFNDELTFIATRFGGLLREIVDTIDRYGLKRRNLGKHKRAAKQFLDDVAGLRCATETGVALQKRIEKNNDKLFTFLNHDDVPWNNNNAEHAVKAFTRLRNVMCTSTSKGTREYCILLSLQQTLRCRGIRFLDFLRSGALEIKD